MGYLGENIGKLGFGLMRLPTLQGGAIDVEQVKEMVDMFLAAGFTYFDTAWAYPGSEDAIRKALVERHPRQSFQLATKNAAWINCKTREEAIAQFETSLRQTGAGYFDFYLLHNVGEGRTHFFEDYDMWSFVQKKKEQGLVKHIGFSFHSTPEELEAVLTAHPEAEFVQLQINYADWDYPAVQSRRCYEVARAHNKPVIVMEPVKGGMLANPPEQVARGEVGPTGRPGTGGPGYRIREEFSVNPRNSHEDRALAMARSMDPNSAGSQFYFCLGPQHGLDSGYTVFGQTVEGADVIGELRQGDVIVSVTIEHADA